VREQIERRKGRPSIRLNHLLVGYRFKNKESSPDSGGSGGTEDKEKVTFDQMSEGGEKNEEGGKEGAGEMGTSEEGEGPQVGLFFLDNLKG
jgi:hypothetical protein